MDWFSPTNTVLGRISDPLAAQYWDRHHVISQALAAQIARSNERPQCCLEHGFYWDVAAVYPPHQHWAQASPAYVNGPVAPIAQYLQAALSKR